MSKHLIRVTASITVAGTVYDLGPFKTISEVTFAMSRRKSTRAAGEKEVARRGRKSIEDITIGRENDGALDLDWLRQVRGCEMIIGYQPLDDDLNPKGKPIPLRGKLADVVLGDGDAEADDEPSDFKLVMSAHGD